MTNSSRLDRPFIGALYMIGGAMMFALMAVCIKSVSRDLPNTVIVFWRNCLALILMAPLLIKATQSSGLKTLHIGLHLIRSFSGIAGMYLMFLTIGQLKIAEAVLLSLSAPLFIPIVAHFWIGEFVTRRICVGVWLGFAGILAILKPGMGIFQPVALAGICAGMLIAVSQVSIRRMSDTEPPIRIVFYFTFVGSLVSAVPLFWTWREPTFNQSLVLLLMASLALIGQLLLTRGYNMAPASKVGGFIYFNVIFSALFGWFWWNEALDWLTIVGAILVISASIITISSTSADPRQMSCKKMGWQ